MADEVNNHSVANKAHFESIAHKYDDNDYAIKRAEKFDLPVIMIIPGNERPTDLPQQSGRSTISMRTQLLSWSTPAEQVSFKFFCGLFI